MKPFSHFLSVLAGCLFASLTLADDLSESVPLVWDKVPIPITLGIGEERIVTFSEPVEFNSEPSLANLTDDKLRVFNHDQTLYLQAEQVFDAQRGAAQIVTLGQRDVEEKAAVGYFGVDRQMVEDTVVGDVDPARRTVVQRREADTELVDGGSIAGSFPGMAFLGLLTGLAVAEYDAVS